MLKAIFYRHIFLLPILVGVFIQIIKMFIYSMANWKMDYGRILKADGMPNLHTAVFSSLVAGIGIKYGYSTLLFSVVAGYSIIIIHDTLRLKREKEKQVSMINSIISSVREFGEVSEGRRRGVLQFRILDILAGAFLGVTLTYILIY